MQPFPVRRLRSAIASLELPARVLLVTHDDNLRAVASRALHHEGFAVEAVAHAGHALLACLGGRRFDVLAAELEMRDTPGPLLAEQIRRHHPGLPVVYLAEAGTAPRDGVLVRPFIRDDLARALNLALAAAAV